jgi:hypothetical protein
MTTAWDWLAVALFIALSVTYLERSVKPGRADDRIYHYLPPAGAFAAGNWLGNNGHTWLAASLLAAGAVFFLSVIRPFRRR